jgi:NAD(P)-dependent dehydrogenase (short-subunit alcohol dehydrogenase family)
MSLRGLIGMDGDAVVVTGAAAGIGKATALGVASCGGTVLAVDQDEAGLEVLAKEVAAAGGTCRTYTVDATSEQSVAALGRTVEEEHGDLVGLVNVVGINDHGPFEEVTLERWQKVLDLNLTTVFLMTRAFLPILREHRASIVNIASTYGMVGNPRTAAYCATKGGVINLTRQLAVDFARRGVRVNAVCPGPTMTPRLKGYFDSGRSNPENARGTTLLGRFAEPHEIGNVVAFLLTPAASYVDGSIIAVDGGQTCHTGALTS